MLEFLNNLDAVSVVFGVLVAFIGNLILSFEQFILEKISLTIVRKMVLRKDKVLNTENGIEINNPTGK